MLKRQRQTSPPPPSSSSVPLISNDPVADMIERERDSKRRRTLPPSLDGAARGWAKPEITEGYDDDQEEQYSDEEDAVYDYRPTRNQVTLASAEYKSTNTMLRDLHTLHQHRLLFSSPSPAMPHITPTKLDYHSTHDASNMSYRSPSKTYMQPQPERLRPSYPSVELEKGLQLERNVPEEAEIVNERYENTNKCVVQLCNRLPSDIELHPCQAVRNVIPVSSTCTRHLKQCARHVTSQFHCTLDSFRFKATL